VTVERLEREVPRVVERHRIADLGVIIEHDQQVRIVTVRSPASTGGVWMRSAAIMRSMPAGRRPARSPPRCGSDR
jgi:hypothetical protein